MAVFILRRRGPPEGLDLEEDAGVERVQLPLEVLDGAVVEAVQERPQRETVPAAIPCVVAEEEVAVRILGLLPRVGHLCSGEPVGLAPRMRRPLPEEHSPVAEEAGLRPRIQERAATEKQKL